MRTPFHGRRLYVCIAGLSIWISGLSPTCPALALPPSDEAHGDFQNKWAVVVGVDNFLDKQWHLKYALKDAQDIYTYLVKDANFPAANVRMLTGKTATKSNVLAALDSWLPSVVKPKDLVLIYIRTRGTLPELDSEHETYLATSDTDADHLNDSAIMMTTFPRHVLENIRAGAIIVIVDSDFSNVMLRTLDFPEIPSTKLLPEGSPFQIICSAHGDEISWESKKYKNSVFTHHLLEACRQMGDSVLFPEVINLASKAVVEEVRNSRKRKQYPEAIGMVNGASQIAVLLAKPLNDEQH